MQASFIFRLCHLLIIFQAKETWFTCRQHGYVHPSGSYTVSSNTMVRIMNRGRHQPQKKGTRHPPHSCTSIYDGLNNQLITPASSASTNKWYTWIGRSKLEYQLIISVVWQVACRTIAHQHGSMIISAVSKLWNITGFKSEQMSSSRKHWLELNHRGSGS
jgi:hypothetical protein